MQVLVCIFIDKALKYSENEYLDIKGQGPVFDIEDIVLYSSSQIVVFYGSNSWAYTRLGHITDQDASAMATLLGHGAVTITISLEEVK